MADDLTNSKAQTLSGLTVLSCRQEGRGLALAEQITERGGRVVDLPLIEVVPPADGGAGLRRALERLDTFDWLACTSVNGVAALAGTELPVGLRLAAVGPATADAFTEVLGRSPLVVPAEHTAAALARGFPPHRGRVLAALAELAGDDLADGLTERGYEVEVVVAYATATPSHTPEQLRAARGADVVVISSGSVAERLTAVLGDDRPRRGVAIGPRSAEAAKAHGFDVVETTADGIVRVLEGIVESDG